MRAARAQVVATALVASLVIALGACSNRPPDDDAGYVARIAAERAAKDAAFAHGADSPVPPDRRAELLPLAYFPIDRAYSVPAALKPIEGAAAVKMPTSTGQMRDMRRVGTLEFTLKGRPLKLTAFVEVGAPDVNHLFVPFTDLTSGTETYAGGRYLDLDRTPTGLYNVDFNRAYQPFCYFNATYDCPYPPPENRLSMPIHAGERLKTPNK